MAAPTKYTGRHLKFQNVVARLDGAAPEARVAAYFVVAPETAAACKAAGFFTGAIADGLLFANDSVTLVSGTDASPVRTVLKVKADGSLAV